MAAFEIPLTPQPQKFVVQLAGAFYRLAFRWCAPNKSWIMDIADANDAPIIGGIPLITGADLLAQYEYLGIGGKLIVQSSNKIDMVPTFTDLGSLGHLYFVPAAA